MMSVKDKVYHDILEGIINRSFPLDELLGEKKLCEYFGVSRSPVREALAELTREGILKSMPRAGYQIVRISEKQMRDAFQIRLLLEKEGLKQAWERLNDSNIASLKAIIEEAKRLRSEEGMNSLLPRLKLNDEFHIMLCGFSGNELLGIYLGRTMRLLHRGLAQHILEITRLPGSTHSIHDQVVEALEERNKEKALRYLKEDIYSMEKELWEVIV